MATKITKQTIDFSKWYKDICENAQLTLATPMKGVVIFEPYSFEIWERIQFFLNKEFKSRDVSNVSMPMLIPASFLEKEKTHIKGFAPELFTVTKIGDKDLKDNLIIRPTSETIFAFYFKNRIQSYKQLPLQLNQWASVMRAEKNTKPFLRTSEFLWQEGHTCHATAKEANLKSVEMWEVYNTFINEKLLISTIKGTKTEMEKFSGANETYTIETIMKDGQALQSCTSHDLGQNFSSSFDIKFLNKDNKQENVFQTSWGMSTRIIGAIIMNHGDDFGLVLPPEIAPYEIVVIEIFADKNSNVSKVSNSIKKELQKNFRIKLDNTNKSVGFKSQEWEAKGVPIRIEVGPRELENNNVVLVNRVNLKKTTINLKNIKTEVKKIMDSIQKEMTENSQKLLSDKTKEIDSYDEMKEEIVNKNICIANFYLSNENENQIKEETGATIRCILEEKPKGNCFLTGKKANSKVMIARAY